MADDANDIPDIGDIPLTGTPETQTETVTETPTEPVQPAGTNSDTTETNSEGESTPPTGDQGNEAPASATEPSKLAESATTPAHQAWIERQRTKNETTRLVNENYQAPTEQQLVDQGMSEQEARLEAKIQEVNFATERSRVAELNASLRDEAVQVQQQFDVFNPSSPNYDEEFATQVGESYKQYARVNTDENGIVMNADVPLYDYYQQQYNLYNRGLSRGQQNAQANSEHMLARTENPGGSSSKTSNDMSPEDFLATYGDQPLF